MHSASLIDRAAADCWLDRQLIAPPICINAHLVVGFLLSMPDTKSNKASMGTAADNIVANNAMGLFAAGCAVLPMSILIYPESFRLGYVGHS